MLVDRLLQSPTSRSSARAVRSLTFLRASSSAGSRALSFSQHQMAFWKSSANSSKWAAERRNRSSFSPWGMTASIRYWATFFLRPRFSAASAASTEAIRSQGLWTKTSSQYVEHLGPFLPRLGHADLDPERLELQPDHPADLGGVVAELATLDAPERLAIGQVVRLELAGFLVHLGGVDVVALLRGVVAVAEEGLRLIIILIRTARTSSRSLSDRGAKVRGRNIAPGRTRQREPSPLDASPSLPRLLTILQGPSTLAQSGGRVNHPRL